MHRQKQMVTDLYFVRRPARALCCTDNVEQDLSLYSGVLEAIEQNSPEASIFVLIHKMDLVSEDDRHRTFKKQEEIVMQHSHNLVPRCFATSIWDETLYKAWSSIVYSLIPHVQMLERHLEEFCTICEADEVGACEHRTRRHLLYNQFICTAVACQAHPAFMCTTHGAFRARSTRQSTQSMTI